MDTMRHPPSNLREAYQVHVTANKQAGSYFLSYLSYSIKAALHTSSKGIALPTNLVSDWETYAAES